MVGIVFLSISGYTESQYIQTVDAVLIDLADGLGTGFITGLWQYQTQGYLLFTRLGLFLRNTCLFTACQGSKNEEKD
ncbi:hypothetical protein U0038_03800 [Sphingobacterium spiritivorum]|uniref:Uncharacterized protein n=1 Tax=Sphingobacterium spiritivorum ATCC 33861 TaxID=525373 RepID=D7VGQ6_SPHSI|nr:hypothetical protein [Sphingobacterium spiritivorum]EFK59258.1 hypothetical protein HMPREF0766_10175 [Sphingobacterium spiritivorum ATCC 33861]WQD34871.1 hypothetical protein U0038_03800 [Sphingobacterium spiritivorum]